MQSSPEVEIEVVRPFWYAGESHNVGARLSVSAALAATLLSSNKAKYATVSEKPKKKAVEKGGEQ